MSKIQEKKTNTTNTVLLHIWKYRDLSLCFDTSAAAPMGVVWHGHGWGGRDKWPNVTEAVEKAAL